MNNLDNIWYSDEIGWVNYYDLFSYSDEHHDNKSYSFQPIISKPNKSDNFMFIILCVVLFLGLPILGLYFLGYFLSINCRNIVQRFYK